MHESGLARAIAGELRERGLTVRDIRLLVRHGHDAPEAFDAALRAHLALEMPGTGGDLEIVHRGSSLPAPAQEQVEIEVR